MSVHCAYCEMHVNRCNSYTLIWECVPQKWLIIKNQTVGTKKNTFLILAQHQQSSCHNSEGAFIFFLLKFLSYQEDTNERECCTHPACYTHTYASSQPLANEFSLYSAHYARLTEGAIHWSVHLSLSCPLYLTVKINGKHPERTWTLRCITACQPSAAPAASVHFDRMAGNSALQLGRTLYEWKLYCPLIMLCHGVPKCTNTNRSWK